MRAKNLSGILLLLISMIGLTSCNDEKNDPLRFDLDTEQNNSIDICFPRSEADGSAGAITILGGDGDYTAYCDNPEVLKIDMKFPNAFVLYPQDWGEANVIVRDGTEKSIVLKVNVFQMKSYIKVEQLDVVINGDENLTQTQKDQLRKEAMETIPVKQAGGGYTLISDNRDDPYSGSLLLYPNQFGNEDEIIKGSFNYPIDRDEEGRRHYSFFIDGKEHILYMTPYKQQNKSVSPVSGVALIEDVTTQIATQYPGVKVYTAQVLKTILE